MPRASKYLVGSVESELMIDFQYRTSGSKTRKQSGIVVITLEPLTAKLRSIRHLEKIVRATAETDLAAAEVGEAEIAGMTCPNSPGVGPPSGDGLKRYLAFVHKLKIACLHGLAIYFCQNTSCAGRFGVVASQLPSTSQRATHRAVDDASRSLQIFAVQRSRNQRNLDKMKDGRGASASFVQPVRTVVNKAVEGSGSSLDLLADRVQLSDDRAPLRHSLRTAQPLKASNVTSQAINNPTTPIVTVHKDDPTRNEAERSEKLCRSKLEQEQRRRGGYPIVDGVQRGTACPRAVSLLLAFWLRVTGLDSTRMPSCGSRDVQRPPQPLMCSRKMLVQP
ncbi:hypothetical protein KCV03_g15, partial [Aureobasidium melanogenum]